MTKKVLVWDSSIFDMIHGGKFGGIAVQLKLWMDAFYNNGWEVNALSRHCDWIDENGVKFHKIKHVKKLDFLLDWFEILRILSHVKPDLILIRGAQRVCYPLSVISRFFGSKLILFGASDVNFIPGKANVGNTVNIKLYERAVKNSIDYIVTQNSAQSQSLRKYFNRDSLVIPNIWSSDISLTHFDEKKYDVIWVSNFRRLKRAEWVIYAAQHLPQFNFIIVGGSNDDAYYNEIRDDADKLNNVEFIGARSLNETSQLISASKILLCTSEYEGFPNTFLQAWSSNVPVISTVDPNNIIIEHSIGCRINSKDDLIDCITMLLNDSSLYQSIAGNIRDYFETAHSVDSGFLKLNDFISVNSEK